MSTVNQSDDNWRSSDSDLAAVTHRHRQPADDMDDRDSVYLDTISLSSGRPNNRRSISLSRQTIYHSAEDLTNSSASSSLRSCVTPTKVALNERAGGGSGGGGGDAHHQPAAAAAASSSAAFLERMRRPPGRVQLERPDDIEGYDAAKHVKLSKYKPNGANGSPGKTDEVSDESQLLNNKTVTYYGWRSRVTSFRFFFVFFLFAVSSVLFCC